MSVIFEYRAENGLKRSKDLMKNTGSNSSESVFPAVRTHNNKITELEDSTLCNRLVLGVRISWLNSIVDKGSGVTSM